MTAEEWNNAAKNSWLYNIGRRSAPITNGYPTTPIQHTPSWMPQQIRSQVNNIPVSMTDSYNRGRQNFSATNGYNPYTVQNSPPINQALNENFQPQSTIQFSNYNGQPVSVPSANASEAWSNFGEYLPDAARWVGNQATENLAMKGFTGKTLGEWAGIGARKLGSKVAGSLIGGPIGTTITWMPEIVEGARYVLNTPTAKTVGRGIQQVINWGL